MRADDVRLRARFGDWGVDVARLARGDDKRRVEVEENTKGTESFTGQLEGAVPSALSEAGSGPITGNVEGRVTDQRRLGADLVI